jgi:glycosyltransferase involved in cell wall biosynthesis
MKIQFILNYSDLYGANRSILSVIKHFHKKGHIINVMIPSKGGMYEELMSHKISCDVIPYYAAFLYIKPVFKHLLIPFLAIIDLFLFPLMVFKVKRFNPDIIYSNTSAENFGMFIAKLLEKKHILHVREFMDRDYNSHFVLGKKNKSRFINCSDVSIYVSKAVLNSIHGFNVKDNKQKIIYNGIESDLYNLSQKVINVNAMVFGIVGILDPAKGQDTAIRYFLEILKEYPNAKLLVYGDKKGAYKKKLIKLVSSLNLNDNVMFLGFETDTKKVYNSIDILLMFSKSEGFGRVTVEAAFNGVPVIGFDNAGTSELIVDRETGCLFRDLDSFNESVCFMLKNTNNYHAVREKAFHNAWGLYSQEVCCNNVEKVVLDLFTLKNSLN